MLIEGVLGTSITKKDKNVVLCVETKNKSLIPEYCRERRWMEVQEVDDEVIDGEEEMEMGCSIEANEKRCTLGLFFTKNGLPIHFVLTVGHSFQRTSEGVCELIGESQMSDISCGKLKLEHQMLGHPSRCTTTNVKYELDACVLQVIGGEPRCEIESVNCMAAMTLGIENSRISNDAKHDLEKVKVNDILHLEDSLEKIIVYKYGAKPVLQRANLSRLTT